MEKVPREMLKLLWERRKKKRQVSGGKKGKKAVISKELSNPRGKKWKTLVILWK